MKRNDLDVNILRSVLDYDPVTGVMRWKVRVAQRIHVGDIAGCLNSTGYLQVRIGGVTYSLHRLAWIYVHGTPAPSDLDHIDRNRQNNAISNLRLATRSQNMQNARAAEVGVSGLRGVGWHKASKRWRARLGVEGQRIELGGFADRHDAYHAYQAAAAALHTHNPCAVVTEVPRG